MSENLRAAGQIDENGIIQKVNQDYCTLLGYSPEEMVGRPISEFRAPNFPSKVLDDLSETLKAGKNYSCYTVEQTKDGSDLYLAMSLSPIFQADSYKGYHLVKKGLNPAKTEDIKAKFEQVTSGKLVVKNGFFTNSLLDRTVGKFFNLRLLPMTGVIATFSSAAIIGGAFAYQAVQKTSIEAQSLNNFTQLIQTEIDGLITEKKSIGLTNNAGLINSAYIRSAVGEKDGDALFDEFAKVNEHYKEYTPLKNVKLEFINKDGTSIFRSYDQADKVKPIYKGDLAHIKKALDSEKGGFFNVLSDTGIQLTSITPIKSEGKFVGVAILYQGVRSIKKKLQEKGEHKFLISISKKYLENHADETAKKANKDNPSFGLGGSHIVGSIKAAKQPSTMEHIELFKDVDMNELGIKGVVHQGDMIHVSTPLIDAKGIEMGHKIVTMNASEYEQYLTGQMQVVEESFFSIAVATLITSGLLLSALWLLIIRRIETMEAEITESVQSSDLSKRVHVYGKNELAKLGRAYNNQISTVQQAMQDIQEILSKLSDGDLSEKINTTYQNDFGLIKDNVNGTVESLEHTFSSINSILTDLRNGELNNEHNNDFNGQYGEIVNSAIETMNALSGVIASTEKVMKHAARGDFEQRIDAESINGELRAMAQTINTSMQNLSNGFDDIVHAAQRMADGDFTQKIESQYEFKIDEAKQAINKAITDLSDIILSVKNVAISVRDSSESVAQGTEALNERTQEQAASLEETSSAMEQTASQVEQNLELTSSASSASVEQTTLLAEANSVMQNAQESMIEIQSASSEIITITESIESIAFQTNLLALNAAVEAARAGEHGRGFAVVAGEVRTLAGKAAESANTIKSLIDKTSEAITKGVDQVDNVGVSLGTVSAENEKVSQMIKEISNSSNEQATGIGEVNKAITSIDSVTQQNASLVEETYSTTEELKASANSLIQSVERLKVNQTTITK